MWETYQRLRSIITVLRTYISNSTEVEDQEVKDDLPPSIHMINISGALTDLSALHAKVWNVFL